MTTPPVSKVLIGTTGLLWLGAVLVSWNALLRHTYQTSAEVNQSETRKSVSSSEKYRVIVFAHPFCPCTRATLNKLDESLTRFPAGVSIRVIFSTFGLPVSAVSSSAIVAQARRLKGVEVESDNSGTKASEFNAKVSGEVFAFNRQGSCVFHGGLTSGRGHQGESIGQRELELRVCENVNEPYIGPVFGCTLPVCTDSSTISSSALVSKAVEAR
jgi:hypothetical protein